MQLIADISGRRITITNLKQEANCFGAAQCAGVGIGMYSDFNEVKKLFKVEEEYLADKDMAVFYQNKFDIFLEAYQGMLKSYDMISELEKFAASIP
jgi:sugar (pentulose or hexulose) kinase